MITFPLLPPLARDDRFRAESRRAFDALFVVRAVVAYRLTPAKGMTAVPRKEPEIKKLYGDLIARLTLRTIGEAFEATSPDVVAGVVFNVLPLVPS